MKRIIILLSLFYFALNVSTSCDEPHISDDEKTCLNEGHKDTKYHCCYFKFDTNLGEYDMCIGMDKSWTDQIIRENAQQFIDKNKEAYGVANVTLQDFNCKKEEKNGSSYLKTGFLLLSLLFI